MTDTPTPEQPIIPEVPMKTTVYKTVPNAILADYSGKKHLGTTSLVLAGWVQSIRNHGGVLFVDLRDETATCQIVFRPEVSKKAHTNAQKLRNEWVISVRGVVQNRSKNNVNSKLPHGLGHIELEVHNLNILNEAETPIFDLKDEPNETLRLTHRYLDLRRPQMQRNLRMRYGILKNLRARLDELGFVEVATPILNKTTPEGARDYLVPARNYPGQAYALPQSPQLFKQILMTGGFERYFQIAKCFRDEDLRSDRQPEFTQLDLEMSFTNLQELFKTVEIILLPCIDFLLNQNTQFNLFHQITYAEAIQRFGTERPDTRYEMEIKDPEDHLEQCTFQPFRNALDNHGIVRMLNIQQGTQKISRRLLDTATQLVQEFGAEGLTWMKIENNHPTSNVSKFFNPKELTSLMKDPHINAKNGDMLLFVADKNHNTVYHALGNLRSYLAYHLGVHNHIQEEFKFNWITDFPLFEKDDEGNLQAKHHPFTMPLIEDLPLLKKYPEQVNSYGFDLVLNGIEIGGGSLRIHQAELQHRIFRILKIPPQKIETKFGFLLNALKSGAPPHGGFALGLDRLFRILFQTESIRDVIAFPKTQKAQCLMSQAPSHPDRGQWNDLYLRPTKPLKPRSSNPNPNSNPTSNP